MTFTPSKELARGKEYLIGEGVVPTKLSWCIPWIVVDNKPDRIVVVNFGLRGRDDRAMYEIYDCSTGKGRPKWLGGGVVHEPDPFFQIARENFPRVMNRAGGRAA